MKWYKAPSDSLVNTLYSLEIEYEKFTNWAKKRNLKGFRPEQAPFNFYRKDFLNDIVPELLREIITKENIEISKIFNATHTFQEIKIDTNGKKIIQVGLTIEIYPIAPQFNFKNVEIKEYTITIQAKDVDQGISDYLENNASEKILETKRPSKKGDFLKLLISVDDSANNYKNSSEEVIRLGYSSTIPSIEAKLMKQYEGAEIFHEIDQVKLCIQILEIKDSKPLTLEEALVKLNVKTYEELKVLFEHDMKKQAEIFGKKLKELAIKKVLLDIDFEIPMSFVKDEYLRIQAQTLEKLEYDQSLDLEKFIQNKLNVSLEKFRDNLKEEAYSICKINLLLANVKEKANISISEEEIDLLLKEKSKFFKTEDEFKQFLSDKPYFEEELKYQTLQNKTLDYIESEINKIQATLSYQEISNANYNDLIAYTILNNNQYTETKGA